MPWRQLAAGAEFIEGTSATTSVSIGGTALAAQLLLELLEERQKECVVDAEVASLRADLEQREASVVSLSTDLASIERRKMTWQDLLMDARHEKQAGDLATSQLQAMLRQAELAEVQGRNSNDECPWHQLAEAEGLLGSLHTAVSQVEARFAAFAAGLLSTGAHQQWHRCSRASKIHPPGAARIHRRAICGGTLGPGR